MNQTNRNSNFFEIPNFKEFANILHDRLHAVLYHIEEPKGNFSLITNLLDRDPNRIEDDILIYGGLDTQKRILDTWKNHSEKRKENWDYLNTVVLKEDMEQVVAPYLFLEYREGKLESNEIQVGSLAEYFKEISNPLKFHEDKILGDYFNYQKDDYLSLPIISFGEFEGVVHIIFQEIDEELLKDPKVIKRLIKLFTIEYESLVLDWDLVGINVQLDSQIKYDRLEFDTDNPNPIIKELNLKTYYKISTPYYKSRIEQNDVVPKLLLKQQRQTAIITILVDSYAHNISAHSLTALNWWFRERAAWVAGKSLIDQFGPNANPLIKYGEKPLSKELYPLFKFLLEKGAFWSGITRKTNFGGKAQSLYKIFWFDFINSPLYLGTIANTEGVNRINLYITIYEDDIRPDGYDKRFYRQRNIKIKNGKKLSGKFVTIDLWETWKEETPNLLHEKYEELLDRSSFVHLGEAFEELRTYMKEAQLFLPGGVVGKHALFTIIENEIRNVKHYPQEEKDKMSKDGLNLHLSFQPLNVRGKQKTDDKREVFQVGVWLGHTTELREEGEEDNLVLKKMQALYGPIMETKDNVYKPKLGGVYQDKICGSMLFNNDFGKVQDFNQEQENKQQQKRSNSYYPWIVPASTDLNNPTIDFELIPKAYNADNEVPIKKGYLHKRGIIKKFFYVWQGADIYYIEKTSNFVWENIARFKFIYIEKEAKEQYKKLKAEGIVRILQGQPPKKVSSAYQQWLKKWLKSDESAAITFKEGNTNVGRIIYTGDDIIYKNNEDLRSSKSSYGKIPKHNRTIIKLTHGGKTSKKPDVCNFRTYGVLLQEVFGTDKLAKVKSIKKEELYELYEILATKVCVFDKRVMDRIRPEKQAFYRDTLKCDIRKESLADWEEVKKEGFENLHFLVVHLSFMESMKDETGKNYGEKNISKFVKNEILNGKSIDDLKENFVLVITTGRGRMEWWKSLEDSKYSRFTTFRPIESILAGVEDAIQKNDDIDLKYNMTKILFGS